MDKNIIFAAAGGTVVGSLVTFCITKKILTDRFNDQITDIQEDYDERLKSGIDQEVAKELADQYKEESEIPEEDISEERKAINKSLQEKRKKPVKIAKTDYAAPGKEKKTQLNKLLSNKCQIIDLQQYSEDENGYDKLSYSVFKGKNGDWAFINLETDTEDLNIATILDMDLFRENSDVENLYIRNDQKSKDFEFIIHNCSYNDWLLKEEEE